MQIEERLPDSPVINADQFKAIVIPGEIYYNKDLTPQEKFLLSLIWWLDGAPHHCYASNKYLAKHMNLSEKSIENMISVLKKKGHIQLLSWNGKIRVIKCTKKISL
jgi:DNA-binding MarR family transcriptional regulator